MWQPPPPNWIKLDQTTPIKRSIAYHHHSTWGFDMATAQLNRNLSYEASVRGDLRAFAEQLVRDLRNPWRW